jgi:hypothetical protein
LDPRQAQPRTVEPRAAEPRPGKTPASTKAGSGGGSGKPGSQVARTDTPARGGEVAKKLDDWRTLRRSDPDRAREVTAVGRAREAAVSVTTGALGGVYPSPNRGTGGAQPWGYYDCDGDWSFCFGFSYGYCSPCSWWWWPCYWTWFYPCWWYWYRPYYYPAYSYYPLYYPVYTTTVVYPSETSAVVYSEAQEPVGEAVSYGQAAPSSSPLSIAAQRYLELGDRAFREGRYTDAVQFYAKAVEFAPDQGALYLVLADALFAAGDYHYGAYAVRRALELDPALIETTVDKHGFYPDPAIFDQHLQALERYLAEHPTDRDARLVLALNFLFGGRAPDAVRTLEADSGALADDAAAQKVLARARALAQ